MDPDGRTTRECIADHLRDEAATPSALSAAFGVGAGEAVDHVRHLARSLAADDGEERLLVAPPECRDCGFDGFDDPANRPSRCPDCKSESVAEPAFRIDVE